MANRAKTKPDDGSSHISIFVSVTEQCGLRLRVWRSTQHGAEDRVAGPLAADRLNEMEEK